MPNNVMSLPNLGDIGRGDNKKKTIGGVDASMITRMKRDQAIVSELRTEPTVRTGVSFPITSGPTGGSGTLVYSFPAQQSAPFVVGERLTVSGNTGFVTAAASVSTSIAAIPGAKITAVTNTTGGVTLTLPTTGVLVNGQKITFTGTVGASNIVAGTTYTISALSGTSATLLSSTGTAITTVVTGSLDLTVTVTEGGSLATLTYATTGNKVFEVGDRINVAGHDVNSGGLPNAGSTGLNGTSLLVTACAGTSVQYQTTVTFSTITASATDVTIRPVSSRNNGDFTVTACGTSTVTVTSIYGLFGSGVTSGSISGNLPLGSSYQQIRDGMKTRGFTDGPIMPFYARGGSLGFYRVV